MSKLFAIYTFLLYIGTVRLEEKFDPKKYDYCKIRCKGAETFPHTVCNCKLTPPRKEVLTNVAQFRQTILDEHNRIRDRVASGRDIKENQLNKLAPAASNMMILKYDMELEYISRCYARSALTIGHDKCRRTGNNMSSGQNIAYDSGINPKAPYQAVDDWYSEVQDLESTQMDSYPKDRIKNPIGHFTQLVWALTDSVGCSFSYHPKYELKTRILCNYASRRGDWRAASNLIGYPTYQKGPPCTACPFGTKCDSKSKYPSLCGELVPAPKDAPYHFVDTGGSNRIGGDKTVVIFTLFLVMLVY